jgi:oxygen-independent coproporphyrinogen-3 oxidase
MGNLKSIIGVGINPDPISLYIHIPYCVRKCPYCDFNSFGVGSDEPESAEAYVEAVIREIEFYFSRIGERPVQTIFFGGGTPSLLSAEKISRILSAIPGILPDAEITLEANPGTVQEELGERKLRGFVEAGVNRLSFGAQSFSQRKLTYLGRLHQPDDIRSAVRNAVRAGFVRINLDLIFGTPEESLSEWREDLLSALSLSPEHLSVYGLTIEPGTEFGRMQRQGRNMAMPDDHQAELFALSQEILSEAGFIQYEVSNYSLPGKECQHNLNYWRRGEYLGIGAGAHGFLNEGMAGVRWRNLPGVDGYIKRVSETGRGLLTEEGLSQDDAVSEFISLSLRTGEGLSLGRFEQLFRKKIVPQPLSSIEEELLSMHTAQLRVSRKGFLFVDYLVGKVLEWVR